MLPFDPARVSRPGWEALRFEPSNPVWPTMSMRTATAMSIVAPRKAGSGEPATTGPGRIWEVRECNPVSIARHRRADHPTPDFRGPLRRDVRPTSPAAIPRAAPTWTGSPMPATGALTGPTASSGTAAALGAAASGAAVVPAFVVADAGKATAEQDRSVSRWGGQEWSDLQACSGFWPSVGRGHSPSGGVHSTPVSCLSREVMQTTQNVAQS